MVSVVRKVADLRVAPSGQAYFQSNSHRFKDVILTFFLKSQCFLPSYLMSPFFVLKNVEQEGKRKMAAFSKLLSLLIEI